MRYVLAPLMCLGWAVVLALTPAQGAANSVAAVWRERHVDFVYAGRTTRYSCEGLRDKVRAMLLDLGARRDLKIVAIGCKGGDRLRVDSAQPSLSILFTAPALPDDAVPPLRAGDVAVTDARFVPFTITGDAFRNMGLADCELVQEFARQILPRLVTRHLRQDITCMPLQHTGGRFWVHGEILRAIR